MSTPTTPTFRASTTAVLGLLFAAGCGVDTVVSQHHERQCFAWGDGATCSVESCCTGTDCALEASDGTSWDCGRDGVCGKSDGTDARSWCEIAVEERPDFERACPYEGTWALTSATCGPFEFKDLDSTYAGTTVRFETPPGGGCDVAILWTHDSGCEAVEQWQIAPDQVARRDMEVRRLGIASCDPVDSCALGDQTEVDCEMGDRAGTMRIEALEDIGAKTLTVSGPWDDVMPMCRDELALQLTAL